MPGEQAPVKRLDLQNQCIELLSQKHDHTARCIRQTDLSVCAGRPTRSRAPRMPCAATRPNSAQWARMALMSMVRWRTGSSRERCRTKAACSAKSSARRIACHPVNTRSVRARDEQAVERCHEHRALDRKAELHRQAAPRARRAPRAGPITVRTARDRQSCGHSLAPDWPRWR